MTDSVGIAFITCNREDFLRQSVDSFSEDISNLNNPYVIIVNDGKPLQGDFNNVFNNKKNLGVGKTKNIALKKLYDKGCNHIFIIEDDIIKNKGGSKNVFEEYIKYSLATGIQHFMFGYHGPANKGNISKGSPLPRSIFEYSDEIRVLLNLHCVGAFCYYSARCISEVGYMDENYNNAFEHVDHSYMTAKADMIPGYWWWPDIDKSYELLDEIKCSEESSTIRPRKDWKENIIKGAEYFHKKHGYRPAWDNFVPDQSEQKIKGRLIDIFNKYSVDLNLYRD